MYDAAVLAAALLVDRVFGDPRTPFHPVALLGRCIGWWGRPGAWPIRFQRIAGIGFWFITTGLFILPFLLITFCAPPLLLLVTGPFFLKVTFAWRALEEHCRDVEAVISRDPDEARRCAANMVSRETANLTPGQVLSAAYESASENLVDSITAPLFFFVILGLPGAALYRAANTMDAMLGYRDERERLGWWSARADDVLTYLPARLTGLFLLLWFALHGRAGAAWKIYRRDSRNRPGWNGGIPMALIAGGVGVRFEKPGVYTIGDPERPLAEGGRAIIAAIRGTTILFSFCLFLVLLLLSCFFQYVHA